MYVMCTLLYSYKYVYCLKKEIKTYGRENI